MTIERQHTWWCTVLRSGCNVCVVKKHAPRVCVKLSPPPRLFSLDYRQDIAHCVGSRLKAPITIAPLLSHGSGALGLTIEVRYCRRRRLRERLWRSTSRWWTRSLGSRVKLLELNHKLDYTQEPKTHYQKPLKVKCPLARGLQSSP